MQSNRRYSFFSNKYKQFLNNFYERTLTYWHTCPRIDESSSLPRNRMSRGALRLPTFARKRAGVWISGLPVSHFYHFRFCYVTICHYSKDHSLLVSFGAILFLHGPVTLKYDRQCEAGPRAEQHCSYAPTFKHLPPKPFFKFLAQNFMLNC